MFKFRVMPCISLGMDEVADATTHPLAQGAPNFGASDH